MRKLLKYIGVGAVLAGGGSIMTLMRKHRESSEKISYEKINNLTSYRYLLNIWINNLMDHKSTGDYLERNNVQNIAIYGTGMEADILDRELKSSSVKVVCFMESNSKKCSYRDRDVVSPEQVKEMDQVDAIIVVPAHYFESIKENIGKISGKKILSLKDILYDIKEGK